MDALNPGLGHNQPPDEIELLRDRLAATHAGVIKRRDEIAAAEERMPAITDDASAGKAGDYVKVINATTKNVDAARVAAKEPFLASGRAVDTFFKNISEPLDGIKKRVESKLTVYLRRKAEEERLAREAEARRLREEAEARAREAEAIQAVSQHAANVTMEAAIATEAEAIKMEQSATARPAELSRTRGEINSVASLRATWVGEIIDRAQVDLEVLRPYIAIADLQKALNGAVKAGARDIRGCLIEERQTARVS